MATGVRDKYHVAINGRGYMLRGAPESPAYSRGIIPSQIERMTISDIAYSDFAGQGLFYVAQTDWSAGIKNESVWRDDAKFWYSTNIDTFSEHGAIKLLNEISIEETFTENVICGAELTVAGSTNEYVGTQDGTSDYPVVYKRTAGSWADISGAEFNTSANALNRLYSHKDTLWALTVGGGNASVINSYNGSAWTDHSAAIITAITGTTLESSRCCAEVGETLYVGYDDNGAAEAGIVKTADNGTSWTEVIYKKTKGTLIDMIDFEENIYYLIWHNGEKAELRKYDIGDSADILVYTFYGIGTLSAVYGLGGRLLHVLNNKLIITIPDKEVWEFDGTDLARIYNRDDIKNGIGSLAVGNLTKGGIIVDSKIWWGNLMYDGEYFFNTYNSATDTTYVAFPLYFLSATLKKKFIDNEYPTKVYDEKTTYKNAANKNYLILNEISLIPAIDKLLNSVTLIFNELNANESIKIQYSIDNRSTWVTIGSVTTAEGSNIKRVFNIPGSVIFNKIWFKIFLNTTTGAGSGTTTPVLKDLIMSFLPMPDYKSQWKLMLNFSDGVKLLNKQREEYEGNELNAKLWNEKLTKQKVIFEDIDYIECSLVSGMTSAQTSALVDSAKRFPRQGRIRAVSGNVAEEMYYTSAQSNKILGITRGARGTKERAYSAAQQLDNGYYIHIEDIKTNINFTDEKKTESIAQVLLIEA